jgi:hypothetical protein
VQGYLIAHPTPAANVNCLIASLELDAQHTASSLNLEKEPHL